MINQDRLEQGAASGQDTEVSSLPLSKILCVCTGFSLVFLCLSTVKSHSKIDKTKVLKPCGTIMQVKSTAECSMGAFCNTFDLYYILENLFLVFF